MSKLFHFAGGALAVIGVVWRIPLSVLASLYPNPMKDPSPPLHCSALRLAALAADSRLPAT